jgi:hypothetical protein
MALAITKESTTTAHSEIHADQRLIDMLTNSNVVGGPLQTKGPESSIDSKTTLEVITGSELAVVGNRYTSTGSVSNSRLIERDASSLVPQTRKVQGHSTPSK